MPEKGQEGKGLNIVNETLPGEGNGDRIGRLRPINFSFAVLSRTMFTVEAIFRLCRSLLLYQYGEIKLVAVMLFVVVSHYEL